MARFRRRVARTVVATAVAVAAILAANSPAPPPVQAAATATTLRVMPLGDSITFGVGSSTHDGYRSDLWTRLRNVGLPVDFSGSLRNGRMGDNNHEGHIGWRIDQVAAQIDGWMATYRPDVVLIHLGTNDIGQNYDMAGAPGRLSRLIDRIVALRPGVKIFVATLVWMVNGSDRYTKFNDAIPGIVASKGPNVRLIPQHLVGRTAGDLVDSAHPSNCGYAKMSYVWYYTLGRTSLNTTGRSWPTGNYPFKTTTGPCAS